MRIEKAYYKKWIEEIKQILHEGRNEPSPAYEEQADEKRKIEAIRTGGKPGRSFPRPFRKAYFRHLAKCAAGLAEEMSMDVSIYLDAHCGTIQFTFGHLVHLKDCPRRRKRILGRLIRSADSFWCSPLMKYGEASIRLCCKYDLFYKYFPSEKI